MHCSTTLSGPRVAMRHSSSLSFRSSNSSQRAPSSSIVIVGNRRIRSLCLRMSRVFTRQEFYDLVWSKPTTHLAEEFALSDVALHKTTPALMPTASEACIIYPMQGIRWISVDPSTGRWPGCSFWRPLGQSLGAAAVSKS